MADDIPQITLPDVNVIAGEPPAPIEPPLDLPDTPLEKSTAARLEGYTWPEIDGHIAQARQTADAFGYSQQQVDDHLGYRDPSPLIGKLALDATTRMQDHQPGDNPVETASGDLFKQTKDGLVANPVTPAVRQDYADALNDGQVKSQQDFAQAATDAVSQAAGVDASQAVRPLAAQLPDPRDATDYAIGVAATLQPQATEPPPATVVNDTRANMLNAWAETGQDLGAIYQTAHTDPFFREALTNSNPTEQATTTPEQAPASDKIGRASILADMLRSVAGTAAPISVIGYGMFEALHGEEDTDHGPPLSIERVGDTIGRMMKHMVMGIPDQVAQGERVLAGGGTPQDKIDLAVTAALIGAGSGGVFHGNVTPGAGLISDALKAGGPGPLADTLAAFKRTLADTSGAGLIKNTSTKLSEVHNFAEGEAPMHFSAMDTRLRKLTGSINAGSMQIERFMHSVPDEWRSETFQNKVGDEVETRLFTPGTQAARGLPDTVPENTTRMTVNGKSVDIPNAELEAVQKANPDAKVSLNAALVETYGREPLVSPAAQEYLDVIKPLTDTERGLADRIAAKTGVSSEHFIGVENGYMHRIWDQKQLASLDPNVAMELTSGVVTPNKLSKVASGMQHRSNSMYVYDHGDGTRVWGTDPLENLGDNPATEKPYKIGDTYVGPSDKPILIGRPTMKEIEANTPNFTGSHNHLVNTLINVDRLQKVDKVLDFISGTSEDLQNRGQFIPSDLAKLPKGVIPDGFIKTDIPGLAGYMDPRIANPINDYWKSGQQGDLLNNLNKISQYIINPMFLDPIPHTWNMANGYLFNRAADWINPMGYVRQVRAINQAVREIASRGPVYQEHVAAGSGLPYASQAVQNFRGFMAQKTLADMKADPATWGAYAKGMGVDVADLYAGMQKNIHSAMWWTGDVMKFSRELEWRQRGYSLDDAIRLTEKDMASYQLPSELLGSRFLSQVMKQPFISAFGRFKYALVNSVSNFVKDVTGPLRGKLDGQAFTDAVAKATIAGAIAYYQVPFLYNHGVSGLIDKAKNMWQGQNDWSTGVNAISSTSALVGVFNALHSGRDMYGNQIIKPNTGWQQKVGEGLQEASKFYWPAQVAVHGINRGWGSALDDILGGTFFKTPYVESKYQTYQDQLKAYNEANKPGFVHDMNSLLGGSPPPKPKHPPKYGGH